MGPNRGNVMPDQISPKTNRRKQIGRQRLYPPLSQLLPFVALILLGVIALTFLIHEGLADVQGISHGAMNRLRESSVNRSSDVLKQVGEQAIRQRTERRQVPGNSRSSCWQVRILSTDRTSNTDLPVPQKSPGRKSGPSPPEQKTAAVLEHRKGYPDGHPWGGLLRLAGSGRTYP